MKLYYKVSMLLASSAVAVGVMATGAMAQDQPSADQVAKHTIMMHESSGNPYAVNPGSGSTGLFQCLPSAHDDCPALGDVAGQNKWADTYVAERYGNWSNALDFWNSHNWY